MRRLKRYLTIVAVGVALLVTVLALSFPRGPIVTTLVIIDERVTASKWRAHSYPNDQYDPGIQFVLLSKAPMSVQPGQTVIINGTINWRSSPARYSVAGIETDVPPFTPGYVDVPIGRNTETHASQPQGSTPSNSGSASSGGTPVTVGSSSLPGTGIYDTKQVLTFVQRVDENEWITREADGSAEYIVRFDFDEKGREVHKRRWTGYNIKGATLIVAGEAAGYDDEGRPIIRVWSDAMMRSPNTP